MLEALRRLIGGCVVGLLALGAVVARADPPYRAARLAFESGVVTFSPAGDTEWARAPLNQPLATGDRLWVESGGRAELQVDGAALRFSGATSASLLNLDDRIVQVRMEQGSADLHVWRIGSEQDIEVDTPNLAFSIRRPGIYRIDVNPDDASTAVLVRSGAADVYGEGASFRLAPGDGYRFYDTGLRDYERFAVGPPDALDRWSAARDRRWERSASAHYVPRGLIGYEDLDDYGSWRDAPGYGQVWIPTRAPAGWAPYRDGHWAWVDPWGWTWIDDAPWGFASSHYGRWARVDDQWAWVPGPASATPVYAPALVAFVSAVAVVAGSTPAVAWFPLAPQEVYRPAYPASREYFTRVNTSNTVVNVTNITNVYNTTNVTNVVYANQRVPGAVVAVPRSAFVQAQPVARAALAVQPAQVASARATAAAPVAPVRMSVLGAAPAARKPPAATAPKPVIAHTAPPPPPVPVAQRLAALSAQPGRALPPARAPAAQPATAMPSAAVKLAQPTQTAAAPATAPPPALPGGRAERHATAPLPTASESVPASSASRPGKAAQGPQTPRAAAGPVPAPATRGPPAQAALHAPAHPPASAPAVAAAPAHSPRPEPAGSAPPVHAAQAPRPPAVSGRVAPEPHEPTARPSAPAPQPAGRAAPAAPPIAAHPAPPPQAVARPAPPGPPPVATHPATHSASAAVVRAEKQEPPVPRPAKPAPPPERSQHATPAHPASPEPNGTPANARLRREHASESHGG